MQQVEQLKDKYEERVNEIDKLEHHISNLEKHADIISRVCYVS